MALRVGTNGIKGRRPLSRGLANLFYPADISGGVLWLDASDASTITESGGAVSQWDDKFPTGNNAVQATGSEQPLTGSRTQNGLNVIDFQAAPHFLDLPSALYTVPSGSNTIFMVSKADNNTTSMRPFAGTVASGVNSRWVIDYNQPAGDDYSFLNRNASDSYLTDDSTGDVTSPHVITAYRDGTARSLSIDGATAVTDTDGVDITVTGLSIGARVTGASDLDGFIAELLIYNRLLTTAEMVRVELYLKTKWGI